MEQTANDMSRNSQSVSNYHWCNTEGLYMDHVTIRKLFKFVHTVWSEKYRTNIVWCLRNVETLLSKHWIKDHIWIIIVPTWSVSQEIWIASIAIIFLHKFVVWWIQIMRNDMFWYDWVKWQECYCMNHQWLTL